MQFKVPGKLILSGEYAILYPNQIAIVAATNRTLTVAISHSDIEKSYVYSCDNDTVLFFDALGEGFIDEAIRIAMSYIRQSKEIDGNLEIKKNPIKITLESELSSTEKVSLGLGSSAAVVVGVIKALLEWHNVNYDLSILFKLAYIAHFRVQGSGSGVDIAAAVYGGIVRYESVALKRVLPELMNEKLSDVTVYRMVNSKWSGAAVTPLKLPDTINSVVFWTGEKASTKDYIKRFYQMADKDKEVIDTFLLKTHENVKSMELACHKNHATAFLDAVKSQRQTLLDLEHHLGLKLESKKHTVFSNAIAQIGAAKFSGAGGGDCAIGFYKSIDQATVEQLLEETLKPLKPLTSLKSQSSLNQFKSNEEQLYWDLLQKT